MPVTCLIAAHDPWFIQLLRIYAEETGLRVAQAFVGQDVLPMVHQEHPSVVFLQAELPGQLKSRDVIHSLKADTSACHIPILVFTWQEYEPAKVMAEGVAAYLQEPVTYDTFVDALRKVGVFNSDPT